MNDSLVFYWVSAMAALAAELHISSFIGSGELNSLSLGAAHD